MAPWDTNAEHSGDRAIAICHISMGCTHRLLGVKSLASEPRLSFLLGICLPFPFPPSHVTVNKYGWNSQLCAKIFLFQPMRLMASPRYRPGEGRCWSLQYSTDSVCLCLEFLGRNGATSLFPGFSCHSLPALLSFNLFEFCSEIKVFLSPSPNILPQICNQPTTTTWRLSG